MRAFSFALLIAIIAFASGCGKKPDATGGDKGGPTPAPNTGGGDDKSTLQGSWSVVKFDMQEDEKPDEFTKKIKDDMMKTLFTVKGDLVTIEAPEKKNEDKGPKAYRITLDSSKSPKWIDFLECDEKGAPKPTKTEKFNPDTKKIDAKEVPPEPVLCIYKFEGDTLVVAVPVNFLLNSPRPTEFKAITPDEKKPKEDSMIVVFHVKKK